MGKASRDKGNRREREFAKLVGGQRVPLSGAMQGYDQDVILPNGWKVQVKSEADGWRKIYKILEAADVLALKADNRPWLVVLPVDKFLELSKHTEHIETSLTQFIL